LLLCYVGIEPWKCAKFRIVARRWPQCRWTGRKRKEPEHSDRNERNITFICKIEFTHNVYDIYVYICIYMYICMMHVCARFNVDVDANMNANIDVYSHVYSYVYNYTYARTCTHNFTHARAHT